jgi:hypothetical protein
MPRADLIRIADEPSARLKICTHSGDRLTLATPARQLVATREEFAQ